MSVVRIDNLNVEFPSRRGNVLAVRDVSLEVAPGEVLGLVGESGAGKSTVGNALINLLEPPGRIVSGTVLFDGTDLTTLDDETLRGYRGSRIGMIFQDPQTSLNPLMTVGDQLIETLRSTKSLDTAAAEAEAIALLESVGISEPRARLKAYPHQFSGGMRQRVVIALALSGDPDLIIADEPTTALDVSIQAQILELIKSLCASRQLGVILVTHDIGVIAEIADRVAV
ncbi:MAG: ABC transporter ATP-binding protein, partial [Pseudomonadota bacterium]